MFARLLRKGRAALQPEAGPVEEEVDLAQDPLEALSEEDKISLDVACMEDEGAVNRFFDVVYKLNRVHWTEVLEVRLLMPWLSARSTSISRAFLQTPQWQKLVFPLLQNVAEEANPEVERRLFGMSMNMLALVHYYHFDTFYKGDPKGLAKLSPFEFLLQSIEMLEAFAGWNSDTAMLCRLMLYALLNLISSGLHKFKRDVFHPSWKNLFDIVWLVERFTFEHPLPGTGISAKLGMHIEDGTCMDLPLSEQVHLILQQLTKDLVVVKESLSTHSDPRKANKQLKRIESQMHQTSEYFSLLVQCLRDMTEGRDNDEGVDALVAIHGKRKDHHHHLAKRKLEDCIVASRQTANGQRLGGAAALAKQLYRGEKSPGRRKKAHETSRSSGGSKSASKSTAGESHEQPSSSSEVSRGPPPKGSSAAEADQAYSMVRVMMAKASMSVARDRRRVGFDPFASDDGSGASARLQELQKRITGEVGLSTVLCKEGRDLVREGKMHILLFVDESRRKTRKNKEYELFLCTDIIFWTAAKRKNAFGGMARAISSRHMTEQERDGHDGEGMSEVRGWASLAALEVNSGSKEHSRSEQCFELLTSTMRLVVRCESVAVVTRWVADIQRGIDRGKREMTAILKDTPKPDDSRSSNEGHLEEEEGAKALSSRFSNMFKKDTKKSSRKK